MRKKRTYVKSEEDDQAAVIEAEKVELAARKADEVAQVKADADAKLAAKAAAVKATEVAEALASADTNAAVIDAVDDADKAKSDADAQRLVCLTQHQVVS